MARELRCGDIVEGCDFVARGEDEDEVLREGARHARQEHGIEEMDDETRRKVRGAIREV